MKASYLAYLDQVAQQKLNQLNQTKRPVLKLFQITNLKLHLQVQIGLHKLKVI